MSIYTLCSGIYFKGIGTGLSVLYFLLYNTALQLILFIYIYDKKKNIGCGCNI